jgi:hypothetical protein
MKHPGGSGTKRRPKAVNFLTNGDDHVCVLLASLGFSTAYICKRTGLSESQVTYRIQKAGLTLANHMSRSDFRNGSSPFSDLVLGAARQVADVHLIRHLKANL